MRLDKMGVIAGSTKNLAAQITFLSVHITDLRSAVGALRIRGSLAGIAVGIFYTTDQNDLAITRHRHAQTLTNFCKSRACFSSAGVPAGPSTARCHKPKPTGRPGYGRSPAMIDNLFDLKETHALDDPTHSSNFLRSYEIN